MIKPILNRFLSIHEFYGIINGVKKDIEFSGIDDRFKEKLLNRLNEKFDEFKAAANKYKKNPETIVKKKGDQKRDKGFQGFRDLVKAHTSHWNEEVCQSATVLEEIIRRHGWSVHLGSDTQQTASVNSMIAEMQLEKNIKHIRIINSEEWFDKLIEFENEYEQKQLKATQYDAQRKATLTESRKVLYNNLKVVLNAIKSEMYFNPSPEVTSLIKTINQTILSSTTSAKSRKTKRENKKYNEEDK